MYFCKFVEGSFSAMSKSMFASEYSFYNIFQALNDLRTLHRSKLKMLANFGIKISNFDKISATKLKKLYDVTKGLLEFEAFSY